MIYPTGATTGRLDIQRSSQYGLSASQERSKALKCATPRHAEGWISHWRERPAVGNIHETKERWVSQSGYEAATQHMDILKESAEPTSRANGTRTGGEGEASARSHSRAWFWSSGYVWGPPIRSTGRKRTRKRYCDARLFASKSPGDVELNIRSCFLSTFSYPMGHRRNI